MACMQPAVCWQLPRQREAGTELAAAVPGRPNSLLERPKGARQETVIVPAAWPVGVIGVDDMVVVKGQAGRVACECSQVLV